MDLFNTEIKAIDPNDGELKYWSGPHIKAISFSDAQRYCNENGLGYCKVIGLLEREDEWLDDNSLKKTYDRNHKNN